MSGSCSCGENDFSEPGMPACYIASFKSAIIGFIFGFAIQNIVRLFIWIHQNRRARETTEPHHQGESYDMYEKVSEADLKCRPPNYESSTQGDLQNVPKLKFAHRCAKVEHSLRKLSVLSGLPHGLIEARGKDLEIVSMDRVVRRLLGYEKGTNSVVSPKTVHDLLPIELRSHHRKFLAKAVEEGDLPSSLMHPMRNIPMLRGNNRIVRVDLCVGIITKVRAPEAQADTSVPTSFHQLGCLSFSAPLSTQSRFLISHGQFCQCMSARPPAVRLPRPPPTAQVSAGPAPRLGRLHVLRARHRAGARRLPGRIELPAGILRDLAAPPHLRRRRRRRQQFRPGRIREQERKKN